MIYSGTVYKRFLGIILPICVAVFILLIAFFELLNFHETSSRLEGKLLTVAASHSLILAESVYKKDVEILGLHGISIISDPDFVGFEVMDKSGEILESFGSTKTRFENFRTEQSITYADESNAMEVGTLTMAVSSNVFFKEMKRRILYDFVLLLALITAVLFGTRTAYNHSMGNPLRALINAIDRFDSDGVHEDIKISGNDELGTVIESYNHMQCQRLVAERELRDYQQSLQRLVEERTSELQHEVFRHKNTADQLFQERQRAEVTLSSIADAVITTNVSGEILYANPAATKILGLKQADLVGNNIFSVVQLEDIDNDEPIQDSMKIDAKSIFSEKRTLEARLVSGEIEGSIVEITTNPLREQAQGVIGISIIIRDITNSRKLSQKLSYQASHDGLTDLINRREFERLLSLQLTESDDAGKTHALFYLDLDRFKLVNDTCGHMAGDELLKRVAIELKSTFRKGDVLARLGGDEFGALLPNCRLEDAYRIAVNMCQIVRNIRFNWNDNQFRIGVSIGIVSIGLEEFDVQTLLTSADEACYIAKQDGGNRIHVSQQQEKQTAG